MTPPENDNDAKDCAEINGWDGFNTRTNDDGTTHNTVYNVVGRESWDVDRDGNYVKDDGHGRETHHSKNWDD